MQKIGILPSLCAIIESICSKPHETHEKRNKNEQQSLHFPSYSCSASASACRLCCCCSACAVVAALWQLLGKPKECFKMLHTLDHNSTVTANSLKRFLMQHDNDDTGKRWHNYRSFIGLEQRQLICKIILLLISIKEYSYTVCLPDLTASALLSHYNKGIRL